MGLVLVAKNADFSANHVGHVGLYTTVTSGLLLLHETRRSASKSINNSAPDGPEGSVSGAPTYAGGYATVTSSGKIEMAEAPAGNSTLITILRTKAGGATSDYAVGSLGSSPGTTGGLYLANYAYTLRLQAVSFAAGSTPPLSGATTLTASITMPSVSRFEMHAGTIESGSAIRARIPRTGQVASASASGREFLFVGAPPIAAGLAATGQDVAVVAFWNRVLSDAEQDTFYAEMKGQLARLGVEI
ncbi:MAG TPA: hypothetical protein VGE09_11200 [Pseudoxanthomonas sp.]